MSVGSVRQNEPLSLVWDFTLLNFGDNLTHRADSMEAYSGSRNIQTVIAIIHCRVQQLYLILHRIDQGCSTLWTCQALHTRHIVNVVEVADVLSHLVVALDALHAAHAVRLVVSRLASATPRHILGRRWGRLVLVRPETKTLRLVTALVDVLVWS